MNTVQNNDENTLFTGLGMASPNSAFTSMVNVFGLAGIVGKSKSGFSVLGSKRARFLHEKVDTKFFF